MSLQADLNKEIGKILAEDWSSREGRVVPEAETVAFGNEAVKLDDAVVFYADLSGSTRLVDSKIWQFAAEIYKSFLHAAAKIVKSEGGTITAYDGDRVMAIFIGDYKNTSATKAALKLNYCRVKIINPLIKKQYPNADFDLRHVVGIDRSVLHAARTGVRGANDLVWVGRAANHAAKLTALPDDHSTWITGEVYNRLDKSVKFTDGKPMWEQMIWNAMEDRRIYRSTWWWRID